MVSKDKEKIILECIENNLGSSRASKKYGISKSQFYIWMKNYKENGVISLENKKKPGNTLMKYSKRKNLNDMEKLEYENMKLRIENERLKKDTL